MNGTIVQSQSKGEVTYSIFSYASFEGIIYFIVTVSIPKLKYVNTKRYKSLQTAERAYAHALKTVY